MKKILLTIIFLIYSGFTFASNDFRGIDFSRNTNYNFISNSLKSYGFIEKSPYVFSAPRFESPLEELTLIVNNGEVIQINYKFNNFQQESGILNYLINKYGRNNFFKHEYNNFDSSYRNINSYDWTFNNKYIYFSYDTRNRTHQVLILPYNIFN